MHVNSVSDLSMLFPPSTAEIIIALRAVSSWSTRWLVHIFANEDSLYNPMALTFIKIIVNQRIQKKKHKNGKQKLYQSSVQNQLETEKTRLISVGGGAKFKWDTGALPIIDGRAFNFETNARKTCA